MHERRVGSVLVTDEPRAPLGILTRHDMLGRVTLPGLSLARPIGEVMSAPVHTLTRHTAQDAALLMSRHGVRHVPVTDADDPGARVVGIVSERDLFALQRLSLKQVSTAIRGAPDVDTLQPGGGGHPPLRAQPAGQGVQARQLTELISHLNDVLPSAARTAGRAARLDLAARVLAGLRLRRAQRADHRHRPGQRPDLPDDPAADQPAWLAWARAVNEALDACGYPLCKGGVMAGPRLLPDRREWLRALCHWIDHGAPQDLLNASIYFDLRPLAGATGAGLAAARHHRAPSAARHAALPEADGENALPSPRAVSRWWT
jgi:CBS domain-containing protein